jgi:hypothetical protein
MVKDADKAADKVEARSEPPGFVPAIVLQNRGVPITLYRLENGVLPELDPDDDEADYATRKFQLRFTANHAAQIEDAFDGITARVPIVKDTQVRDEKGAPLIGPDGPVIESQIVGYEDRNFYGVEAFEQALQQKVQTATRRVLAIAMGVPEEQAGAAMIPGKAMEYQTAVGVAWAIAQGVDPTVAARMLHEGLAAVAEGRDAMASQLEKMMARGEGSTTEAPGPTGSPPGPPTDEE